MSARKLLCRALSRSSHSGGMRVLQHTTAVCVRVAALASTARPTRLAVVRVRTRSLS